MPKDELIEALEKATGPCGELDARICIALGLSKDNVMVGVDGWCINSETNPNPYKSPAYTSSIDAALTLVPEGWSWSVGDLRGYEPPMWRCHVRDHRPESLTPEGHSHIWREGNTRAGPALAICIAALRAKGDQ